MTTSKTVPESTPRIVHVITSLASGGAERTLRNLTMRSRNFEHIIVCLKDVGHFGPELETHGIQIFSMNFASVDSPIRAMIRLSRKLRELEPDLVQTWMYHSDLLGGIAAKLVGVPCVVWNVRKSRLDATLTKKRTMILARILGVLSETLPRKIISCSASAGKNHARDFGYKAGKFHYIPNGVEPSFFRRRSSGRKTRDSSWGNHGPIRVGLVARFHPQKGHEVLIEALEVLVNERVPFNAFFVGAGNSSSNPALKDLLVSKKSVESIRLVGVQNDLRRWYESFDVLVMPSLGGEGFPNVLIEAMASGTPCIASDVGEAATIIGNTGFIVPPGDHLAISQCLKRVAGYDADSYSKLRLAAKTRAKINFSAIKMVENYERTYSSLLSSQTGV